MGNDNPIYNVNSYNQFGGITAGQVNIGAQPRRLDDNGKAQLRQHLSKGKKITITAVLGDGEAFNFATEVMAFLQSEGYEVEGVNQSLYNKPVMGNNIVPKGDGFDLIIGTRQ